MIKIENSPFKGKNAVEQCDNGCVGVYLTHPFLSSIFILSLSNPGGCRGYADVAQLAEHRARRYAQVQVLPSAPDAGSRPDNVRPSVEAHMKMKMVAENCTVGGNRLSVMVLRM